MGRITVKRPTLKAAHEFHRVGIWPLGRDSQYLTEEDHYKEVVEIDKELGSIVRAQFPRTRNLEYAILKAHLIVEHSITQYIRSFAHTTDMNVTRFAFSQKLEIAYMMGFGSHSPTMLPTVELLNKVRNQVAHTFNLNRALVDELIRINAEDYPTYRPKDDRERIRALKMMCVFVSGYVVGKAWGHYFNEHEGAPSLRLNSGTISDLRETPSSGARSGKPSQAKTRRKRKGTRTTMPRPKS